LGRPEGRFSAHLEEASRARENLVPNGRSARHADTLAMDAVLSGSAREEREQLKSIRIARPPGTVDHEVLPNGMIIPWNYATRPAVVSPDLSDAAPAPVDEKRETTPEIFSQGSTASSFARDGTPKIVATASPPRPIASPSRSMSLAQQLQEWIFAARR